MAKMSDDIKKLCETFGLNSSDIWDCHGTWVMKHSACEKIASKLNISFDKPEVIRSEANDVAMIVSAKIDGNIAWSIGEASPKNNKNAYPWAMAEKRGKDRVILKLAKFSEIGVYSDIEADNFKKENDTYLEKIENSQNLAALQRSWALIPNDLKPSYEEAKDNKKQELSQ